MGSISLSRSDNRGHEFESEQIKQEHGYRLSRSMRVALSGGADGKVQDGSPKSGKRVRQPDGVHS